LQNPSKGVVKNSCKGDVKNPSKGVIKNLVKEMSKTLVKELSKTLLAKISLKKNQTLKNQNNSLDNLLEGPLIGKIFAFVIPLMITNLLQTFYSAADMIVVGMSNVDGAIGAIGTTTAMIALVLNVFSGFAVGSSVVVARSIGERNEEKTQKAVHTSLLTGLISGIFCMIIGLFVSRPILRLLGDQGHILDLATLYTKIYFLGVPFLALTNFLISIFRAKGDTKTPLYVLSVSGILNVILNLLFVLSFGMSVDGVAIATAISNFVSAAVLLYLLGKDTGWCRFSFKNLTMDRRALKDIIYNGIPAGVQGALFSISNMIIQSSIIGLNNILCPGGSNIIDGNAAGASLENFAYTATNSVCQAAITFTSQHFGAKKFKRIGKVMASCYLVTFIIAEIVSLFIIIFRIPLIHCYITEPYAVQTAEIRLYIMVIPYCLLAFMEVGSGTLRGLNKSMLSTIVSLLGSCVLRILWIATVFKAYPTLEIVYLSYPISWGVTALCHLILSLKTRKHYMQEALYEENNQTQSN